MVRGTETLPGSLVAVRQRTATTVTAAFAIPAKIQPAAVCESEVSNLIDGAAFFVNPYQRYVNRSRVVMVFPKIERK
jgi:hypothetical protein